MVQKYKLYKSGKFLVAGVIVATGMATTTAISHVNADTVSGDTAQAVQVANNTQNSDTVQLPATSQENNVVDQTAKADQATKTDTTEVKSDVPTSVDNTTTQEQAKTAIDNAQNTVKSNVETAKQAGVVVTEGETQQVTLNNGNAVSKTNEILSDLNKQDLAVQQATATQKANQEAYETSQTNYDETLKQGQNTLAEATRDLDMQIDATQKAGIDVSVALSKTSPEYKDLTGLTGQDLLDAMAYNIDLYQKAIADGVESLNADQAKLEALVADYQSKQADYAKAVTDRTNAIKDGQNKLAEASRDLDMQVDATKQAGIDVKVATTTTTPKFKDLKGLTGKDLLNAMAENIAMQEKAVADGVASQKADQAKLQALVADYQAKQAVFNKATADRANEIKQGQQQLAEASRDLDAQVDATKQAGIAVDVATADATPTFKDLSGLTGQALADAMTQNIANHQKAVADAVAKMNADKAKLDATIKDYQAKQGAYTTSQTQHAGAVAQGQADLAKAGVSIDAQVAEAKNNGVDIDVKTTTITPNYQSLNGLTGQDLLNATQANTKAYQDAVKQAVDTENGTAQSLQGQIGAYKQAISDYQAGVATSTGLKWGHDTYVTGDNKMAGNEVVTSFADPSIKAAAMYAIQGNNLDQNTDANFDNIFKINGSGSVTIHNTTNGDVTITFSNINSPYNTGTYVAVWGADDGGIAFGVFATYSGRVQSGAGEAGGGSAGMAGSGAILNYVYSYDASVSVTGNVSVATFNDIDNNQTVTMNGLDGQVTRGENIAQNDNNFSATAGDVSQGTSNVLDTNSVRWSLGKASPVSFNFHHMTSDRRNTSIVGGIFGADSDIPQEPQKPTLSAEKFTVVAPDAPQAPVAPKAQVTKYTVNDLPTPQAPVAPKAQVTKFAVVDLPTPEEPVVPKAEVAKVDVEALPAPEAPAPQEVEVHYYDVATTPETPEVPETPQAPTPEMPAPVVEKASLLPQTGAEENGHSSVLGALASVVSLGLLGGVARKFKKQ